MTDQRKWLVDQLLKLPGITTALLVSDDGVEKETAGLEDNDEKDRQGAAISGIRSVTRAAAPLVEPDAQWRRVLVEFDKGWLVTIAAGDGASLTVTTTKDVDLEQVAYEMQQRVNQFGQKMGAAPRDTGSWLQ